MRIGFFLLLNYKVQNYNKCFLALVGKQAKTRPIFTQKVKSRFYGEEKRIQNSETDNMKKKEISKSPEYSRQSIVSNSSTMVKINLEEKGLEREERKESHFSD